MKNNKCMICLNIKGRRMCKINQGSLICPKCCAETRNPDCGGCSYYGQAEKYASEKMKKAVPGEKDFIARIDPEVEEAVDNALALVEKGKMKQGEKMIVALFKKHPDLYVVHYGMGTVKAMQGKFKESIAFFDICLDIFPYLVEAWFNKGMSHMNLFDIGGAVKAFQKVIKLGDRNEPYVKNAQNFLDDIKDIIFKQSGLSLKEYVKSQEEFDQAFLTMKEKQYEKAIIGFNTVLKFDKNSVQSHGNLGLCYAYLGKRKEALLAFDRALELDPHYEPAKNNRRILLSLDENERLPDDHFRVTEYYKEKSERRK